MDLHLGHRVGEDAALVGEGQRLAGRSEGHRDRRLVQPDGDRDVVKRHDVLDDLGLGPAVGGVGEEEVVDEPVFRLLLGQGGDTPVGQAGRKGFLLPEQPVDDMAEQLFDMEGTHLGVFGEEVPAQVGGVRRDGGRRGGLRGIVRGVLVGAEVLRRPVEVGVLLEGRAGGSFPEADAVALPVHHIGCLAVDRLKLGDVVVGLKLAFSQEIRPEGEGEFVPVRPEPRFAGGEDFSAGGEVAVQPGSERFVEPDGVREDEQPVGGEIRLQVEDIVEILAL